MHEKYFEFGGSRQAGAFAKGVEYANDGALTVVGIFQVQGTGRDRIVDSKYYVHVRNENGNREDNDPLPVRWEKRAQITVD